MNTLTRAAVVTALGAALIGGPMAAAPMASAAPAKTIAVTKTVVPTPAQKAALEKKKQAFLTKMRNYTMDIDGYQSRLDLVKMAAPLRAAEADRLEKQAAQTTDKKKKAAILKDAAFNRKKAKENTMLVGRYTTKIAQLRASKAKLQATVGTPNGWYFG